MKKKVVFWEGLFLVKLLRDLKEQLEIKKPFLLLFVVAGFLISASTSREKLNEIALEIFANTSGFALATTWLILTAIIMIALYSMFKLIVKGTEPTAKGDTK